MIRNNNLVLERVASIFPSIDVKEAFQSYYSVACNYLEISHNQFSYNSPILETIWKKTPYSDIIHCNGLLDGTRLRVKLKTKKFNDQNFLYVWNFCLREMSCNRIVVSTSRCGRDNPGSNPGYSNCFILNPLNAIFEALIFQFHFLPFDHQFQDRN